MQPRSGGSPAGHPRGRAPASGGSAAASARSSAMTDLDPFDVRLEARLVAHAATARPLHDPGTVARAAIERAGSGHGWRPVAGRGSTRASALAIAATLALLAIL